MPSIDYISPIKRRLLGFPVRLILKNKRNLLKNTNNADNARYYRSELVQEYLVHSRIKIEFLPSYSPNLNLIERVWRFFHKKILYNQFYDTYDKFKNRCLSFFENISKYKEELRTLLTDNFEIIGEQFSKT